MKKNIKQVGSTIHPPSDSHSSTHTIIHCPPHHSPKQKDLSSNFTVIALRIIPCISRKMFHQKLDPVFRFRIPQGSYFGILEYYCDLYGKKGRMEGLPYNAIRYSIYIIKSIHRLERMVKAFILVLRNQKKTKVFVKDIKELCMTAKRKVPPLPQYRDGHSGDYEQRKELSSSQDNGL
jgi:hypothetical protein